jgi:uncharacterized membrane protein
MIASGRVADRARPDGSGAVIVMNAEVEIDRPARQVWALVADYGCDPQWRAGVTTMDPTPPGPVVLGTVTAEILRVGGRTYRSAGEVTDVNPGSRFAWRTTSGADVDADGSRTVEPLGTHRCRVRLETRVRPLGVQRLLAPVLRGMLRRGLAADAQRLRALAEAAPDRP